MGYTFPHVISCYHVINKTIPTSHNIMVKEFQKCTQISLLYLCIFLSSILVVEHLFVLQNKVFSLQSKQGAPFGFQVKKHPLPRFLRGRVDSAYKYLPSGKRSHSWLEYHLFFNRKYIYSIRVHFPNCYVRLPDCI